MKKTISWILLISLLVLAGCGQDTEQEEEIVITEVSSVPGNVTFSLDQNWTILKKEELAERFPAEAETAAAYDLLAENNVSGSSIVIAYEDLSLSEGKPLILMEDYIATFQKELELSEDYSYNCTLPEIKEVYGEEYYTFSAQIPELEGEQFFCIRRIEDTVMVMTFTAYGEDTTEGMVSLGKAAR